MENNTYEIKKRKRSAEAIIEIIVVIMLGSTALLTAWAAWMGSLHDGDQASYYTVSNNLASEGNSEFNAAIQLIISDKMLWNDISDMREEILSALRNDDSVAFVKRCRQLFYKLHESLSPQMADYIGWPYQLSEAEEADPEGTILAWLEKEESNNYTPFFDEEFEASYFVKANELLIKSQVALEIGEEANENGDKFGLVTVIYSVVLFLLGITGSFKSLKNKYAVMGISIAAFTIATIYMFTIPLPLDFSISSFFGG